MINIFVLFIVILFITFVYSSSWDETNIDKIGIEFNSSSNIYHLWNEEEDYYINTTSGIQLTNNYQEYWSHNVLCLNFTLNPPPTNYFRCADELSWNWVSSSDNSSFVNLTGYSSYGGLDLVYEYYLKSNWTSVRIKPLLKNLGNKDAVEVSFLWRVENINIYSSQENDMFELYNGTDWVSYWLNQSLDLTYTNVANRTYYLNEYPNNHLEFGIRFIWNKSKWINGIQSDMDYKLDVKSEPSQYNSPVTLTMYGATVKKRVGEAYTEFLWRDPTYTMTCDSMTEGDSSVDPGKSISIYMQVDMDARQGDFLINITGNLTTGGQSTIDGDCDDANDAFKIVSITTDNSVCLQSKASVATGIINCDGLEGYDTIQNFTIVPCDNANNGDPYTFLSGCVGDSGSDVCSGFPKVTGAVDIQEAPTWTVNLNATEDVVQVGGNINYTTIGTDEENDNYYMKICSSNSTINGECTITTYCTSNNVSSTTATSCAYTTQQSDEGQFSVYGFLCDVNNICGDSQLESTTVNPIFGWLDVHLLTPTTSTGYTQGNKYNITTNVSCKGEVNAKCGTVYSLLRYNGYSIKQWDIFDDEGDGGADEVLYYYKIVEDAINNDYYTYVYSATPDKIINLTKIGFNIYSVSGVDYVSSMDVFVCEGWDTSGCNPLVDLTCTKVADAFNPAWETGWQYVMLDSSYIMKNNTEYTIVFDTPNSNNNNNVDLITLYTDTSATANKVCYYNKVTKSSVYNTFYGQLSFFGQDMVPINTTEGASPFYIISGEETVKIYNYSDITNPSINTNATTGYSNPAPTTKYNGTELSTAQYSNISFIDNATLSQVGGTSVIPYNIYHFLISEQESNINNITVNWLGQGTDGGTSESYLAYLYFWNSTAWELCDSYNDGTTDNGYRWLNCSFIGTTNITNIVDENNILHFKAQSVTGIIGSSYLYTDFIKLKINTGTSNPQSISSLNQGDNWYVNWTINITDSAGDYLIDVFMNSSYGSANVPSNNSIDSLVCIGGCGVAVTLSFTLTLPSGGASYWNSTTSPPGTSIDKLEFNSTTGDEGWVHSCLPGISCQTNTTAIFQFTNTGDDNITIDLNINASLPSFMILSCDIEFTYTNYMNITTSNTTVISNIGIGSGNATDLWLWASFTNAYAGTSSRELQAISRQKT